MNKATINYTFMYMAPLHDWKASFQIYKNPKVLAMLFLGFSAGLPILLVFGTLSAWLNSEGIDKTTIGFVSWVALAYGLKFLWSPLVDRLPLPLLTRSSGSTSQLDAIGPDRCHHRTHLRYPCLTRKSA